MIEEDPDHFEEPDPTFTPMISWLLFSASFTFTYLLVVSNLVSWFGERRGRDRTVVGIPV
jgi:hypothetical protein